MPDYAFFFAGLADFAADFSPGFPTDFFEPPAAALLAAFLPPEVLDRDGFVLVDERLRVPGHPEVFAVGDVAFERVLDADRDPLGAAVLEAEGLRQAAILKAEGSD